ncbi:hypothetical protein GALMADRAFT_246254 [Galerina marginata CBS 339.88]|uniref:Uncharacterized protein n=1 Tax=Galerina marginata (strain CBS 339.88) TaxID=685588 RepID=A0A067T1L0_GALM3|nr:hypothetical protein GALMADRAFT_246254 [Galerina marginata CBS 339.88]
MVSQTDQAAMNSTHPVNVAQSHSNRETVEREIVDCEVEMLALENAMVELKYRHLALNEKLNSTSLIISMLPLDVISDIFFHVYDAQDKRKFGALPAPFILGRICKAWRRIVWSTPRLWSTVMIRFSSKKYFAQEQLLKEWFSRLGNCQLHLFFDTLDGWEPPETLFDFLQTSYPQWKSLDTWGFMGFTSTLRKHSFPSLSHLWLRSERQFIRVGPIFDFSLAPHLQYVHICAPLAFKVCTAQVLGLEVPMDIQLCLTNLADGSFQYLRSLSINFTEVIRDLNSIPAAVPAFLPNLTCLSLAGSRPTIARVIEAIITPRLLSLKFEVSNRTDDAPAPLLDKVLELKTRSNCRLSELRIANDVHVTEAQCMNALFSLPSLTRLSLKRLKKFTLSDAMINTLNPTVPAAMVDPMSPFLPKLIEFHYTGPIMFQPRTMMTMLEQRLLFSQMDRRPESAPKFERLQLLDIKYGNRTWGQIDPNMLQEFYRQLISLSARGTTLNLVWDALADFNISFGY